MAVVRGFPQLQLQSVSVGSALMPVFPVTGGSQVSEEHALCQETQQEGGEDYR